MIFKMAWRNLWRHTRRTLITCVTVGFGIWLAVTLSAVGEHSYSTTIDTGARMGAGHVTVQPDGYLDKPSLASRIDGVAALRDKAAALPHVNSASPRITGQAIFTKAGNSRGGMLIAIDPRYESASSSYFVEAMHGPHAEGALFETPDAPQIVLGRTMADYLDASVGKKLVYTTTDKDGDMVAGAGRVGGIFETGVPEIDAGVVLVSIDKAREVLGYGPDEATLIAVTVDDQHAAQEVRDALAPLAPKGASALTWRETMADLVGFIALDRASNQFFQFFLGLLIAAGILNTILMSVLERKREFGIMMAIGMSPWRLFNIVVAESFFIGLVGLALGVVFTTPWAIYLDVHGVDLSSMYGENSTMGGVVMDPIMRFHMTGQLLAGIVGTMFTLTLLAGVYPAIKAGRVPPVESIRMI